MNSDDDYVPFSLLLADLKSGRTSIIKAPPINIPEIGRVRKISGLPFDNKSD